LFAPRGAGGLGGDLLLGDLPVGVQGVLRGVVVLVGGGFDQAVQAVAGLGGVADRVGGLFRLVVEGVGGPADNGTVTLATASPIQTGHARSQHAQSRDFRILTLDQAAAITANRRMSFFALVCHDHESLRRDADRGGKDDMDRLFERLV
jgi:hypothetical protein